MLRQFPLAPLVLLAPLAPLPVSTPQLKVDALVQRGRTNPPAQKHARQPPTPDSLLPFLKLMGYFCQPELVVKILRKSWVMY